MAAMVTRVGDVIKSSFKNVILVPSVAVALVGFAPPYLATWVVWRGATAFLPQWVYQVGDDFLYYLYQNAVLFFFEYVSGVQVLFDGDAEDIFQRKENAIYLGNHQSTVDWVLSDTVAVRQGSLGNLRYVMKSSLQQLPLYGLYFYEHGCIYVDRGNFDPRKMINSLSYLQHPKINTWMVVFPEGTRFGMARKSDASHRRDANSDAFVRVPGDGDSSLKSNGLEIEKEMKPASLRERVELKHHLLPKSKGTWLALQTLRKQTKAIYSVSVVYEGCVDSEGKRKNAPQILGFLKRECKWVYVHLKRIPIEDVPSSESEFHTWLDQLFVQKDKIVEDFYSTDPEVRAKALARGKPAKSRFMSACLGVAAMSAITVPFFLSSAGQSLYWKVAIFGSLIGYSRLALAAVA